MALSRYHLGDKDKNSVGFDKKGFCSLGLVPLALSNDVLDIFAAT